MENILNINDNEKRVLREIYNHHNISRTQISKNLEINKATISSILNKLKYKSLVNEVGEGDSTKSGGRKPILLKVNHLYGYFISLDLTYSSVEVMYNYFDGNVIKHESYDLPDEKVSSILSIIKKHIDIQEKLDTYNGLLGVSVSIHGVVDNEQHVTYLPFHETEGISIAKKIKEITNVPVVVENEANLSALYERNFNHNLSYNNLIALSIHKGIGEKMTLSKLIQFYNEKNPVVVEEMEQFINKIAVLIHNLNTQFNPNAIYINCPLFNEMPEILEAIKNQFKQYSRNEIQIKLTSNVKFATLLGGTLAIIQKVLQINDIYLDIKA
ncbi:ROK family transcriptional regulator [Staphylococcus aureus]|uniref:ROK family transcriptional regulator n=1 Tax=Staphylococcus aureus TaxID=1280 RepID=UPI0010119049|nr:ROK family transcriptional regulator [Staphylococcus aureus]QAZ58011.1 XylR family transcriptional regulator [Staphylococcus aureus]